MRESGMGSLIYVIPRTQFMNVGTAHRQEVFRQYNRARRKTDSGRANRALGLLMTPDRFKAKIQEYGTNYNGCNCPDSQHRGMLCKHRIAFIINWRAVQYVQKMLEEGKVEFGDDVLAF